jgi:hypothetical protein
MTTLNLVRIPRALDGVEPLQLDMTSVHIATARIAEIASVNIHKAPELLATFNVAYLDTSRFIALVEYEYAMATSRLAGIKSVILLDRMVDILREKGLSTPKSPLGSEDIRQAVMDADPEYKRVSELTYNLKCYIAMLQDNKKSLEMAYMSIKKIIGDSSMQNKQNPYLTVDTSGNTNDEYFGKVK